MEMFPDDEHNIPDPSSFGLHRLSKSSIMSDGCKQARALPKLIADMIKEAYIEFIGKEAWDNMSQEHQDEAARVHIVNCWNNFRNTFMASRPKSCT